MVTGYTSQLATTTQLVKEVGGDSMQITLLGVGVSLGIAVFLVGVGFAWRKIKSKGTGGKF